jgi:hypothetical protein
MFIYNAHKLVCLTNQYKHHIERNDRNTWLIGPCFLLLGVISCVMGFLIGLGQVGHSLFYLGKGKVTPLKLGRFGQ